jgi:hypothetical protein
MMRTGGSQDKAFIGTVPSRRYIRKFRLAQLLAGRRCCAARTEFGLSGNTALPPVT